MNCKNCYTEINLNYCPNCGQSAKIKRIDGHYIMHEIEHILHFERGILFTIRELLIRPGKSIRHFIAEDRARLVKPVIFIIVTSLIYTLILHFFHIEDGAFKLDETKQPVTSLILKWIEGHYGYANIIMGAVIAFWIKIFFKKYNYNYFEIIILLCFVMGMEMLIFSVFLIMQGLSNINLMVIAGCVGIAYCIWAIGQFFDKTKLTYLKAFVAYILGYSIFYLVAILIGTLIDLSIKH